MGLEALLLSNMLSVAKFIVFLERGDTSVHVAELDLSCRGILTKGLVEVIDNRLRSIRVSWRVPSAVAMRAPAMVANLRVVRATEELSNLRLFA